MPKHLYLFTRPGSVLDWIQGATMMLVFSYSSTNGYYTVQWGNVHNTFPWADECINHVCYNTMTGEPHNIYIVRLSVTSTEYTDMTAACRYTSILDNYIW